MLNNYMWVENPLTLAKTLCKTILIDIEMRIRKSVRNSYPVQHL